MQWDLVHELWRRRRGCCWSLVEVCGVHTHGFITQEHKVPHGYMIQWFSFIRLDPFHEGWIHTGMKYQLVNWLTCVQKNSYYKQLNLREKLEKQNWIYSIEVRLTNESFRDNTLSVDFHGEMCFSQCHDHDSLKVYYSAFTTMHHHTKTWNNTIK